MSRALPAIFVALLTIPQSASGATPLVPPQIKDMLFAGQQGASRSIVTRALTLEGDYLYASGQPGLQTIRVSDPADLVMTHDYTATSLQPNQSAVKGGVLYLANWSPGQGFLLLNLTNPAQPTHLRTLQTNLHAWSAEIFGNTLYLTIGAELDSGVNTYDISNPSNPVLVNAFTIGDRLLSNVARFGNTIYFTHKGELRVYDVSNPASPQFVRVINFNSTLGNVRIHNNVLWMLGRQVLSPQQGGLWSFSLANPTNPVPLGYWSQSEPRDTCFLGNFCVVPCSGSGIYTLSIANPASISAVANWSLSWPNTGPHGGYPVCVAGAGRHVFIGTTSGNDPACEDFTCPNYGARVYSAKVLLEPPLIAQGAYPESHPAKTPYTRQLMLTEGAAPVLWSLIQAPAGAVINGSGFVSGWTPGLNDIGFDAYFEVRATNSDGAGTAAWYVRATFDADGDSDGDEDCDQSDFGHLQACFSGDGVHHARGCGTVDFDQDTDVDGADFTTFLECMRGANVPSGC